MISTFEDVFSYWGDRRLSAKKATFFGFFGNALDAFILGLVQSFGPAALYSAQTSKDPSSTLFHPKITACHQRVTGAQKDDRWCGVAGFFAEKLDHRTVSPLGSFFPVCPRFV